ncbi:MAG: secretion protein [Bacteroidales bacterium]|nr:secretion protein [Bacteroidales bacterium]
MKKPSVILLAVALLVGWSGCSSDNNDEPGLDHETPETPAPEHNYPPLLEIDDAWKDYHPGNVNFKIESPRTNGAQIYKQIVPDPDTYIKENARRVLQTLYYSPEDENIPKVKTIEYVVRSFDGVSYKSGSGSYIRIDYSTDWIEQSYKGNDVAKVDYETRGVIYHELTHAYQLEPQGCGVYTEGSVFWAFIEGTADAVRVACGCFDQDFSSDDRPRGGSWMSGYRYVGYFLYWLQLNKDENFIRKFNASANEVVPWSFDAAMKHILGDKEENSVANLWKEYQNAVGDR